MYNSIAAAPSTIPLSLPIVPHQPQIRASESKPNPNVTLTLILTLTLTLLTLVLNPMLQHDWSICSREQLFTELHCQH